MVKATIEKAKKEVEDFEKENQILLTEYRRSRKSNQKAVQRNDNDVIRRMAEIAKDKGCNVVDMMKKQEIQEMLQKNREKKN